MQVCLYVCISFVAHFFPPLMYAMNSMATVTIGDFDSWLCLDASPSGQCMPGIRRWCGRATSQEEVAYVQSSISICRVNTSLCTGLSLKSSVDTIVIQEHPTLTVQWTSEKQTHYQLVSSLKDLRNVYQLFDQLLISDFCSYLKPKRYKN